MEFFEKAGVPLKVERGNRVFPQSDHSSDIIRALNELKQQECVIHFYLLYRKIVKKPGKQIQQILLNQKAALTESDLLQEKGRKGKKHLTYRRRRLQEHTYRWYLHRRR